MRPTPIIAICLSALGVSLAHAPSARADVEPPVPLAVIVHPDVPEHSLSATELARVFTRRRSYWNAGMRAVPFNYKTEDPLRREFDRVVLQMTPDEVGRFWRDERIRHGTRPPRQLAQAALAVRVVASLEGSIAYVPEAMVTGNVRVVARIRDGKIIPVRGAK